LHNAHRIRYHPLCLAYQAVTLTVPFRLCCRQLPADHIFGCHQSLTVLFLFCCRELPADHILGCHQSLTVLFLFCCRELPADHIFGVPSKHESGSVSTLLKGDYSPEQLQDDADLGKSLKEGWRNLGPAGRVSPALCPWPHLLFGCCTELPCNTMWLSALAKLYASLQQ